MSQAEIQPRFTWINCTNKKAAKLIGADGNISHYIRAQVRCSDTNNELLFAKILFTHEI